MRALPHGDRGSAIVEMAILLPLFAMLLFWAVYFAEFSVLRIRQQEASRFLTWESTAHALADFESGRHAPRVETMRRQVLESASSRYQNLEGHNRSARPTTWIARPTLGALDVRATTLAEQPTDALGHRAIGGAERSVRSDGLLPNFSTLVRGLEGALGPGLRSMGLPLEVGVETRLELSIENLLVGDGAVFPERLRRVSTQPATSRLEGETWALGEGSDVGLADDDHPFTRQVARMAFFGLGPTLDGALRGIGPLGDLLPIPRARVVSQRYASRLDDATRLGCEGEELSAVGKWKNGPRAGTAEDRMSPAKCFDTLPMEANGLGAGYEGDPSYRQLRARGEGYMGETSEGGFHASR